MATDIVPFNRPYLTGKEFKNFRIACRNGVLAGDGPFTKKCHLWLEKNLGTRKAFLTHSCTSALEMAAILANIKPGDEVIMPSFTFVSTANAFVLRGGVPVFVDIRLDTLNIDENLIEKAITRKTKAIVTVHYAGVGCEMDTILAIAKKYSLLVIEDAAHAVRATYKGRELGTIGDFGALSFHETKNIISGEGGALLVNNPKFIKRAEIIWQKGTDRSRFMRGEVDKYTWRDVGSSFLPGELTAACLYSQLTHADDIIKERSQQWANYQKALKEFEKLGKCKCPLVPKDCKANGHIYYILLKNKKIRTSFLKKMKGKGVFCVFHYLPLHKSPFSKKNKYSHANLKKTDTASDCIVRFPIGYGLKSKIPRVIKAACEVLQKG